MITSTMVRKVPIGATSRWGETRCFEHSPCALWPCRQRFVATSDRTSAGSCGGVPYLARNTHQANSASTATADDDQDRQEDRDQAHAERSDVLHGADDGRAHPGRRGVDHRPGGRFIRCTASAITMPSTQLSQGLWLIQVEPSSRAPASVALNTTPPAPGDDGLDHVVDAVHHRDLVEHDLGEQQHADDPEHPAVGQPGELLRQPYADR